MTGWSPRRSTKFKTLFFAGLWLILAGMAPLGVPEARAEGVPEAPATQVLEEQTAPKILLISSFHLSHKWTQEVNNAIIRDLELMPEGTIIDYLELNSVQNRTAGFVEKFEPYRRLIREHRYDLVVAILDDAINLLIDNLDNIPADQPIAFCGYQEMTPEFAAKHPNITGLAVNFQVVRTIEMGLALMPETREIAVVTDNFPSGMLIHQRMLQETAAFTRCKITLINGAEYNTQQMLDALRRLPEESFVVFCPWRTYAKDGYSSLEHVGKEIEKIGRTYLVITDVLLGQGALGGCMSRGETNGTEMARIIREVLASRRADAVPFVYDEGEFAVDMAVMRKLGISEKLLPPCSVKINREIPLWESHRALVIVIAAAFVLLTGLIAALIIFHLRFRRVTGRMSGEQRLLIERLDGYVATLSRQKQEREITNTFLSRAGEIAGISYFRGTAKATFSLLGGSALNTANLKNDGTFEDWLIPEDRPAFRREKAALVAGSQELIEMVCRSNSSGTVRTYKLYAAAYNRTEDIYLGIVQDITAMTAQQNEKNELIVRQHFYVENEKVVNACLTQLVQNEEFDHNIHYILQTLARQLDCDRACYGAYSADGSDYTITHEWLGTPHVSSVRAIRDPRFHAQFRRWRELFAKEELLKIPDVRNSEFAEAMQESGSLSLLCAPVMVNQKLEGVVGLGFTRRRQEISAFDEKTIRSVAQILSLASQREARHRELAAAIHDRQAIFRNIGLPIMLFDRAGKLISVNPAACEMVRKSEAEVLSKPCFHSFCCEAERPAWCPVRQTFESGKNTEIELEEHGRRYLIKAEPIFAPDGSVRNVIENAIDITEIYESKRQLEKAMRAEQAANQTKSYFLATMSHEIRTPLNAVIGFSELLKNGGLTPEEQQEYLNSINLAGNSLLRLIDDLLDLSRLEAAQTVLTPQPTDLALLLREVQAIFLYKMQQKQLSIQCEIHPDLPLLKLDNLRLRQILLNLVGNAVKFTANGGITLKTEYVPLQSGNEGTLTIQVRDTGIGIAEEVREKIFDPFVQSDTLRDTHVYKGTGLGLAISQRLAERMGGHIHLESTVGAGSCFTLELNHVERAQSRAPESEAAPMVELPFEPIRALLVDDVPMNLKVLQAMLRKLNIACVCAGNGVEALEILATDRDFQFILTDLWMPEMNGAELAQAVRTLPGQEAVSIVAVTADTESASNFNMEHFDAILHKPFDAQKLQKIFSRKAR